MFANTLFIPCARSFEDSFAQVSFSNDGRRVYQARLGTDLPKLVNVACVFECVGASQSRRAVGNPRRVHRTVVLVVPVVARVVMCLCEALLRWWIFRASL